MTMPIQFKRVALIGKYQTPNSHDALQSVAAFLSRQGCQVVVESETAISAKLDDLPRCALADLGQRCDLVVVVGGDGTMLSMGRQLAKDRVPMIGINQGRLGFITDIPLESFEATLKPMLQGEFDDEERALIHARVLRGGACVFDALAMNDVVVNRGATSGMVELRVEVDGRFVANQRADGLIIATPTGSTAYAVSAGGPLLHPSVPGWLLVPIAPHTLSNRPIVLPDLTEISVEVVAGRDVSANFDMQSLASLQHGDRIVVRRSEHSARFLHPRGWSYFDTLRKKLRWNEGVA